MGTPIQKIPAKITIARRMFTAGPAAIVAIFFHMGAAKYARCSTSEGMSSPTVMPLIFT